MIELSSNNSKSLQINILNFTNLAFGWNTEINLSISTSNFSKSVVSISQNIRMRRFYLVEPPFMSTNEIKITSQKPLLDSLNSSVWKIRPPNGQLQRSQILSRGLSIQFGKHFTLLVKTKANKGIIFFLCFHQNISMRSKSRNLVEQHNRIYILVPTLLKTWEDRTKKQFS